MAGCALIHRWRLPARAVSRETNAALDLGPEPNRRQRTAKTNHPRRHARRLWRRRRGSSPWRQARAEGTGGATVAASTAVDMRGQATQAPLRPRRRGKRRRCRSPFSDHGSRAHACVLQVDPPAPPPYARAGHMRLHPTRCGPAPRPPPGRGARIKPAPPPECAAQSVNGLASHVGHGTAAAGEPYGHVRCSLATWRSGNLRGNLLRGWR